MESTWTNGQMLYQVFTHPQIYLAGCFTFYKFPDMANFSWKMVNIQLTVILSMMQDVLWYETRLPQVSLLITVV